MSLRARLYLVVLGLLLWGLSFAGEWMGWHNFIAICFVLVLVIGAVRMERGSTNKGSGPKGQK